MATLAPGQHMENGVNMVTEMSPAPVEEYGCSGACNTPYGFILILRRERKTLGVGLIPAGINWTIAQIMVSLVMLAFGIVMFEDSGKLCISTGLLYWTPLLSLVGGCLAVAVTNQPNPLLVRLCVVVNLLCSVVMIVSGPILISALDVTAFLLENDCTPPEATQCQTEKFKLLFGIRTNGIIMTLAVLVFFLCINSAYIAFSFRNPTVRVVLRAPLVNIHYQSGPVPNHNTTNEPHRNTFSNDYPEDRPPH